MCENFGGGIALIAIRYPQCSICSWPELWCPALPCGSSVTERREQTGCGPGASQSPFLDTGPLAGHKRLCMDDAGKRPS